MTDPRIELEMELVDQLESGRIRRNAMWNRYWEGRRMVTVPDDTIETQGTTNAGGMIRLFPSFPNLAPKGESWTVFERTEKNIVRDQVIRDCIARLKSARAKESTNRNLSTLLAVVVKVQKDLETLVGEETVAHDPEV